MKTALEIVRLVGKTAAQVIILLGEKLKGGK